MTARLLVLGTHARAAAARAIPGSTSRTILRSSSCPVVVVTRDAVLAELSASAPSATPTQPAAGPERWTLYEGPRPAGVSTAAPRAPARVPDRWREGGEGADGRCRGPSTRAGSGRKSA